MRFTRLHKIWDRTAGLNPETYLNHILTVLSERFSQNPKAAIDDLLPWAENMLRLFQV